VSSVLLGRWSPRIMRGLLCSAEDAMFATLTPTALKAKLFRGFADPTRLSILEVLMDGERSVGDIAQETDATVANVSAHLACLTGCGLVRSERRGKYVYYRLQERRVRDLLRIADGILANVSRQVYECTHNER
jgi:ArsR family transcriptional regulator, cadmium/lead-responsive transcriptional repressor